MEQEPDDLNLLYIDDNNVIIQSEGDLRGACGKSPALQHRSSARNEKVLILR